ncbi:uncharacterized protein LOC135366128 [Ornithodoros turicata]|uniref:uncharacterized protein LOC135366128 n=1 Tax=Ornithodoros turicata TaxID=34597 RepID=UPI0031394155
MPHRCAAVGCTNSSKKAPKKRFFRFPAGNLHAAKRKKWVQAMRRVNEDGSPWEPTANSRVCSDHFVTGAPSRVIHHPDYVPSVFKHKCSTSTGALERFERLRKRQGHAKAQRTSHVSSTKAPGVQHSQHADAVTVGREEVPAGPESEVASSSSLPRDDGAQDATILDNGCQTNNHLLERIQQLEGFLKDERQKSSDLESNLTRSTANAEYWKMRFRELKSARLCLENMKCTEDMLYYTGIPSQAVFKHILGLVLKQSPRLLRSEERGAHSVEDQMFMVLVRLRTGMQMKEISRNFSISMATFSRIFSKWVLALRKALVAVTRFPSLAEVQQHLPPHFRKYPNTRIIIDGTEVRIQKPSGLNAQKQTFSNYKYTNTMKCLVGATPDCYVSFVSALYGGGTSDRAIVQQSALLDLLEPGDAVTADKGFKVDDLLPPGVTLHMPPFRIAGEAQMSAKDVEATKHVASARVHIERVIRRIKEFHILDRPFPINMLDLADAVFTTCALLSNFRLPLISNRQDTEQADSD